MRVLIVEDEEGIREGLASFLRHHGHVVHTAASCAAARAVRASEALDVLVTDWRLTDGTAHGLIDPALPAIVITGCPEEIEAGHAVVLRKPVLPAVLLTELSTCAAGTAGSAGVGAGARSAAGGLDAELASLPIDAGDRVRLLLTELQGRDVRIDDDGTFVTVTFRAGTEVAAPLTARLGGDWLGASGSGGAEGDGHVRWRCYRDGRPAGVSLVLAPDAEWPEVGNFGIDLHEQAMSTRGLVRLLDRVAHWRVLGRTVHVLNVPGHLRLFLELTGRAQDLPMRGSSGPRLSAHQRQLWD